MSHGHNPRGWDPQAQPQPLLLPQKGDREPSSPEATIIRLEKSVVATDGARSCLQEPQHSPEARGNRRSLTAHRSCVTHSEPPSVSLGSPVSVLARTGSGGQWGGHVPHGHSGSAFLGPKGHSAATSAWHQPSLGLPGTVIEEKGLVSLHPQGYTTHWDGPPGCRHLGIGQREHATISASHAGIITWSLFLWLSVCSATISR